MYKYVYIYIYIYIYICIYINLKIYMYTHTHTHKLTHTHITYMHRRIHMYICSKPRVLDVFHREMCFFVEKALARPVRRQSQRARDDVCFAREADGARRYFFWRGGVQYLFEGSFVEKWCTV